MFHNPLTSQHPHLVISGEVFFSSSSPDPLKNTQIYRKFQREANVIMVQIKTKINFMILKSSPGKINNNKSALPFLRFNIH